MVEYTKPEEVVMLREVAASRRGAARNYKICNKSAKLRLIIANQCLEWTCQLQSEQQSARLWVEL